MRNKSSIHKFWLLGVIILVGLGIAFAVPTFARAQQHMVKGLPVVI